jgi:glutamate synthase (ferredoxin)
LGKALQTNVTQALVDSALKIVEKLEHRAGKDTAGETGDGVGLMLQIPHKLMKKAAAAQDITLGEERDYGVGMFFFPNDSLKRARRKRCWRSSSPRRAWSF